MSGEPPLHDMTSRVNHVDVDGIGEGLKICSYGESPKPNSLSLHIDWLIGGNEDGHRALRKVQIGFVVKGGAAQYAVNIALDPQFILTRYGSGRNTKQKRFGNPFFAFLYG